MHKRSYTNILMAKILLQIIYVLLQYFLGFHRELITAYIFVPNVILKS